MTIEEVIKGLKVLRKEFSGYKPNEEMFDMAIEALKSQTKPYDRKEHNIILCKDCKHCTHTLERPNEHKPCEVSPEHYNCYLHLDEFHPTVNPNEDYCSHAELRHGKMKTFW